MRYFSAIDFVSHFLVFSFFLFHLVDRRKVLFSMEAKNLNKLEEICEGLSFIAWTTIWCMLSDLVARFDPIFISTPTILAICSLTKPVKLKYAMLCLRSDNAMNTMNTIRDLRKKIQGRRSHRMHNIVILESVSRLSYATRYQDTSDKKSVDVKIESKVASKSHHCS